MLNKKAQNVVEYILLVTVVLSVCVVFLRRHGPMEKSLQKTLDTVDNSINSLNAEFAFDGKAPKPLHGQ